MTDRAQLALIILDGSSQFTALLDNEGRVLDANRAALEHDGLGREEVIGRAFWETSRWRSAPEASAWLRAAVDGAAAGKPAHGALALPGSGEDGGAGSIALSLAPVRDDSGRVEYLLVEGRDVSQTGAARAESPPAHDASGAVGRDVGERRRIDEMYRAREEQLRLAMRAARMAAWDHDFSTGRINLSVADDSPFGDAPGNYYEQDLIQRIHPEDRDAVAHEIDRARRDGGLISREIRLVLADGSIRWVLSQGRFMPDEAGGPGRVLGVTMDITERKKAEEALGQSERRYRLLFESMAQGVVYQDDQGAIIDMNPAAERILGTRSDELRGQTSVDREPYCIRADGSPFPGLEHPTMVALRTGQPVRNVLMGVRDPKAAECRWIDITAIPLLDPGEERPREVCALFDDITGRRKAEDALRRSECQFRAVFLASRDAILIADDEGRYTDVNPAASELFGLPCDQLVGRRIAEFTEPKYDFAAAWEEFRHGGGQRGTFRLVRPDGSAREVEFSATPDFLPGRHLSILHDVSDRNRAEAALRRYTTRLASLREIDQAILAIQPPETIAKVALRHLARLVPCWRASVAQIGPGAREGRIVTVIGAASRRIPTGTSRPRSTIDAAGLDGLMRGRPYIVDDLRALSSPSEHLAMLRRRGARSMAIVPLLVRGRLIGSINFLSDRPGAYTEEIVEVIREATDQVAIALHNARLYEENRSARGRLEVLSRRIISAQEDERRQIARELHDEIGQALTALKIDLQGLENRAKDRDELLTECIAIVDDSLHRVRGMALDLRPSLLDDLGLVAALQWYVERQARRTGMEGRFVAIPEGMRAAPEVETACFRAAQEAVTNIARHSRARHFSVEISRHNDGLQMIIRDDGCGFEPAAALARAAGGASLGLLGIVERIELVGGKVAFVSAPGKGTELRVTMPKIKPSPSRGGPQGDRP